MLKDIEEAIEVLAHLEGEASFTRRFASCLTANVEENGTSLVVPILIVDPVALLKGPSVFEVVVIKLLSES